MLNVLENGYPNNTNNNKNIQMITQTNYQKKIFNEQEYHLSIISFIITNRNRNNYTHKILGLVETDLIIIIRNTYNMCFQSSTLYYF